MTERSRTTCVVPESTGASTSTAARATRSARWIEASAAWVSPYLRSSSVAVSTAARAADTSPMRTRVCTWSPRAWIANGSRATISNWSRCVSANAAIASAWRPWPRRWIPRA